MNPPSRLEQYRLPAGMPWTGRKRQRAKTARRGRFLKGPVPLSWLNKAMSLSGSALSVGIVLWHYAGLKKSPRFRIGIADLARHTDSSWHTARRGLLALERADLIAVERGNGRKHRIYILEVMEDGARAGEPVFEENNGETKQQN